MLRASIFFFALSLIAYIVGANQIGGVSAEIGKILLFVFLVIAGITLIGAIIAGKTLKRLH